MKRQVLAVFVLYAVIIGTIRAPFTARADHGGGDYRPTSGITETGTLSDGQRYIIQVFEWTQERIDTFRERDNVTYEHDFRLNDSDDSGLGPGIWARDISHWESNMPDAYRDTRFCDGAYCIVPPNEVAFTIGTTDARKLQPDTIYHSFMLVDGGNTNVDNAKLVGDLGHRSFPCSASPWCVFDDHYWNIVAAWEIAVPGVRHWTTLTSNPISTDTPAPNPTTPSTTPTTPPSTPSSSEIRIVSIWPNGDTFSPGRTFNADVIVETQGINLNCLQGQPDHLKNIDGNLYGTWPIQACQALGGNRYRFYFNDDSVAPGSPGEYHSRWRIWQYPNLIGPDIVITFNVGVQATPTSLADGVWLCENLGGGQPCQRFTYVSDATCVHLGAIANRSKSLVFVGTYSNNYHVIAFGDANCQSYNARYDNDVFDFGGLQNQFESIQIVILHELL